MLQGWTPEGLEERCAENGGRAVATAGLSSDQAQTDHFLNCPRFSALILHNNPSVLVWRHKTFRDCSENKLWKNHVSWTEDLQKPAPEAFCVLTQVPQKDAAKSLIAIGETPSLLEDGEVRRKRVFRAESMVEKGHMCLLTPNHQASSHTCHDSSCRRRE